MTHWWAIGWLDTRALRIVRAGVYSEASPTSLALGPERVIPVVLQGPSEHRSDALRYVAARKRFDRLLDGNQQEILALRVELRRKAGK